jgi:hypothetical protein
VVDDADGGRRGPRVALLAAGVPCTAVVPTLGGEPWVGLQDRLLEVEAYVDHPAVPGHGRRWPDAPP